MVGKPFVCFIIPEWCHVVPHYTTPSLYRTKESVFLRGAASPAPYISLAAPVFSDELPAHDLESDESFCDLGLQVVGGRYGQRSARKGTAFSSTLRHPAGCNLGSAVLCTLA